MKQGSSTELEKVTITRLSDHLFRFDWKGVVIEENDIYKIAEFIQQAQGAEPYASLAVFHPETNIGSKTHEEATKQEHNIHLIAEAVVLQSQSQKLLMNWYKNAMQKMGIPTDLFIDESKALQFLNYHVNIMKEAPKR